MSQLGEGSQEPVTSARQLAEWLAAGEKPRALWRVGTEHEKFCVFPKDGTPLAYEGGPGIRALLEGIAAKGWEPVPENGKPVALKRPGGGMVSLEPGGQLELSGAPLATLHDTAAETAAHLDICRELGKSSGFMMLGLGCHPTARREDFDWMPKGRYAVMRRYLPGRGGHGLDMMLRTCTIQANLDFSDEADMARKYRVSLALQPLATALFAASPFMEGRETGVQSLRARFWLDTDPDRCGAPGIVFEPGFGYERYVDYILDMPMFGVVRAEKFIDLAGRSFRDFMAGKLAELPGELPTIGDWELHLSTAFPDVRLKRFLEMRGADCGPAPHITALPAFWMGLLYDPAALDAAETLAGELIAADRPKLAADVPRLGLAAPLGKRLLGDAAAEAAGLARKGLEARGLGEEAYLAPIEEIADSRRSAATRLAEFFHGTARGNMGRLFAAAAL
jgi:glutamate--cysteine ligase